MKHQKFLLTAALAVSAVSLQGCGGSDDPANGGTALGIYENGGIQFTAADIGPEPSDANGMVAQNGWGVFNINGEVFIGFTTANDYSGPGPEDEDSYTGIAALDGFYRMYEYDDTDRIYYPIGEADIAQGSLLEGDWCYTQTISTKPGDPLSVLEAVIEIPEGGEAADFDDIQSVLACAEVDIYPDSIESELDDTLYISVSNNLDLLRDSDLQVGDIYAEGPEYGDGNGHTLTMLSPGNTNFNATGFLGCDLAGSFSAFDPELNIYSVTGTLVEPVFNPVLVAVPVEEECLDAGATFEGVAFLDAKESAVLTLGGEFLSGEDRFATYLELYTELDL